MARTGSSSKFVPVNLNNSYGQTLPLSNGGASASSSLGRSRSFTSSYGGMVSLSRSTRVSSPSPSSASVSASSRSSKLAVPRPMNLPSLRREHSGNDPTIALVGSSGSSGWTKQTGDEAADVSASRSDSHSSSWGNRPPVQDPSAQITEKRLAVAGRQSAYSPPGPGDAPTHSTPVEKAVVFRGEDFPTLQAAAVPYSPSLPPPPRSRDLLSKQQRDKQSEDLDELKQNKECAFGDDPQQSNCYFDQQFQPAQPVRVQVRGIFPEHNGFTADKVGAYSRGPSPLVKLTQTSNWADDERETLTSLQPQESAQSDWAEPNEGFRSMRNWQMDHNADIDFRRSTPRTGYPIRNDADSSVSLQSPSRNAFGKDGDLSRVPLSGGGKFEHDSRGAFDRMNNSVRRNDFLKRGWSFSAAESNLNRDGRFPNSNNGSDRENYANGKAFFREGNNVRHDTAGGDVLLRDARPGLYYQDAGQRQESKFGKDVLLGRQGFPGGLSAGPRTGRGTGFSYNGSDAALPSKQQPEMDYRRDKRASGFYGHVHDDDPFLGDGISTRPTSLYALQPRIKKNSSKDHDYHDPARESFEAELERVEKMLEQERQRVAEERERASELIRKEQEEQERLAREEEEMRIKLEQEVREAAYRAQIEAEDAARRVEEARKAREDEKRMAELEEERRKEAARKKLLELEERMAKRESERKREEALQPERGSVVGTLSPDASTEHQDNGRKNTDMSREYHWKSGKVNEDDSERFSSMVPLPLNSSALPSILRSPRLSPYSKEENNFPSVEGARLLQTWKREPLDSGHDFRSLQKGLHTSPHFQNDRSQQEHEDRQWGSSFRNASMRKSMASTDTHSRPIIDPDTTDERNWWARGETPNKSQHPVEAYPTDASDYPSFGRLRQSLPKQPRVLPPPPGPTSLRKQFVQRDEPHSETSTFDTERTEMAPIPKEELSLTNGESTVSHVVGMKESLISNMPVSEQFDTVPSEEVVLSDAGSQFSDDTVEELVAEAYQEQELHSDAVSETYTEGEVDEISDITEAHESSEDLESQKLTVCEACTGEEKVDHSGETLAQAGKGNLECFQDQHDAGIEGFIVLNKKEEEERIEDECAESGRNITSSSMVEDVANANVDNVCGTQEAETLTATQSVMASGFKDGQESVGNTEELVSENVEQDQEIQPFPYQAPFLPVVSGDATQMRHLESVSSRQSLVQQFQQPFSFMAVPLPQSSTLNHVGASVPMLTPVHGLPNQQELPFHLQLGLLPGVPLMPNAIQIGSIQMPLHIHPQIPQLAHLHGQQAPVFQFGQIGPTLPMSQPIPMTHVSQPAVQMHHAIGQVNVTQQHLQTDFAGASDTKNVSLAFNQHAKFGDVAAESAPLLSVGHNQAFKEDVEVKQMASMNSEGSRIPAEREVQHSLEEIETHSATVSVSKLDGQKPSTADTFEPSWNGDRDQAESKTRPGGKPSRGGRRRAGAPRYQGILGRGRGRFHGGQNHFYQAPHSTSENWPEGGPKRFARGKMNRRNYRRAEYRVREPSSNFDGESPAAEFPAGPPSTMEDPKESGGYRYVKKGSGSQVKNVCEETGQFRSRALQTTAKEDQPVNQSAPTPTLKTNSLLKKYEMDNAEDAPFRTGVVCVFEQPGIETPNDKDDFIKVRSKRQLLRELKEQREKESKGKGTDQGSRDQVSKKQQRLSTKTGNNIGMAGANLTKSVLKRRPTRSAESATTDGKVNTPSSINGATGILPAAVGKRNLAPSKLGRAISASKVVATGMESVVAHENQNSEQLTVSAWGGQRSNQEVVSLTQIQLEEAMKPFRLDAPFSESAHLSEKVLVPLEPGLCSSSALVAVEKPVITSGPLSSLLAGEKIQFGAVTSPTPIPSNSRSSTPISTVRTGSPLGFGMDSSHLPGHTSSFVTKFLEPPLDATFSSKGGSVNKDDGFEGKVVDLELEAEAAAAASAVVAAAISSEDLIESHTNTRVADMNATLTSANPLTVQIQSNSASDNPMAVALPADLSVETPPSLFQGSSMGLSNMSGVMLQSLPGGSPAFPCLEMGSLLGGPVFNFGPREDASLASIEPGISGWQQRHVGTPDSFYGGPPFLSPAGISSIQGHPHMLVYANPYTPVGQFGQLGVSFMGTAYHPSGKQPDWTHIPLSSASSGGLALNNGDLSAGSNGPIASQHLNGPRIGVAGSSVMSVAVPPNLFDTGLAAPFQASQMDGFVQSHWSKAPAPPGHSVPISGSSLPSQNFPLSKPAVDLNMQIHSSRVFPNQAVHPTHSVDASSVFHKPPVLNPASSSSFSSADAGAQFPDELGLGDSMPTVNTSQSDAGGPSTEASHANMLGSVESTGIKIRGRRPTRNSQGNLSSLNSNTGGGELIPAVNFQEQSRSGHLSSEFQSKNVGRIGIPSVRTGNSLQLAEQKASKQGLPKESMGSEWPRGGSQRKGASGRVSISDRGGSVLPSKLKQIYVAKPAADGRKLSAACS